MATVKWDEGLRVGAPEIDCQHKALFKMTNCLLVTIHEGKGKEVSSEAAKYLIDFFDEHFQIEEKMMRDNKFAGYKAHKKEHDGFLKGINKFAKGIESGVDESSLVNMAHDLICERFKDHIKKSDQALADFMSGKPSGKAA